MQRTALLVTALVGILVFVLLVGGLFYIRGVNTVVTKDEVVKGAWSEVENQLQRRSDLIPNYVETVKGYAAHEKEVFTRVAEARSKLNGAMAQNRPMAEKVRAANEFEGALARLLVLVERYPDLKANQNFLRLQDELAGTENRIAVARGRYNRQVESFNAYIRRIPGSFFAARRGLEKAEYFKATEQAKEVPKVDFGS